MKIIRLNPKHHQIKWWYGYLEEGETNITLHRENGPAWVWKKGPGDWYWHGELIEHIYSQKQFEKWLKLSNF